MSLNQQEVITTLKITYNWQDLDFLRLAFKYGKHYENVQFIQDILRDNFAIVIDGEFNSAYSLSRAISKSISESELVKYLQFTFHCFSKIANRTMDRRVDGKSQKGNSRLLEQILKKDGKYFKQMHTLKHLFIELNILEKDFKFGDSKFLLKTRLD